MSTIINVIVCLLIAVIGATVLIYMYEVPIQKVAFFGFGGMILVLVLIGLVYGVSQSEKTAKTHNMKSFNVMEQISNLWELNMGRGNSIELYTGKLVSTNHEDGKRYWGGCFIATSGRHDGTPVVIIYCADDDDLCYINPAPLPQYISNPFFEFEPMMYSSVTRDKMRNSRGLGSRQPYVNVNMDSKSDKTKKENDEFEKMTNA